MCEIMDGQASLFDPDSWCGRMSLERSAAESQREQTSQPSSKKSSKSQSRMPVCLCVYPTEDGQNRGATTLRMVSGQLLGEYTMHSFGESPSEENVSRLSQILEDCPHPKYSLSARACEGILNRAERRGKELPKELKAALIAQSACKETELTEATPPDATVRDGAGGGSYTLNTIDRPAVVSFQERVPESQGGAREYSCKMNEQERCQLSTINPSMKCGNPWDSQSERVYHGDGTWHSLNANENGGQSRDAVVAGFMGTQGAKAQGIAYEEEKSPTLKAGGAGRISSNVMAVDCRNGVESPGINGTLQAKANGGISLNCNNVIRTSE